ncbi:vWA domain-containing protein [Pseudorhizobium flavum]|uniref:vWA domain-containing protein n=1 Tax=Pseudorhizobium flavum TaxID=1335061 RepID=UPI0024939D5D|nr:VWA domain-containing protein [Pseudorhizobium flavum]
MRATRFPERQTVPERMAGFMAHLRLNGLNAGMPEGEMALAALHAIDATDHDEVRLALKSVCARGADGFRAFDELFDAYWLADGRRRERPARERELERRPPRQTSNIREMMESRASGGVPDVPDNGSEGESEAGGTGRLLASRIEAVRRADLRGLVTPEELAEAEAVARQIARALRDRRSRRRKAARRGALLDLRRIARRSVAHGGDPVELLRRRRPDRPVNIVAICDVSGSMSVYARIFLAFLQGLVSVDSRTDAFLLHTRLVRISDALRDNDTLRAVERLSLMANGFGGGTRIGANLKQFNDQYARGMVTGRTVVVILSDGYDTDPADQIGTELARLRRRGCKIVWLNPLKGWGGYEPVARGMAAALPHLDLFAAANTLDALAALEPHLRKV